MMDCCYYENRIDKAHCHYLDTPKEKDLGDKRNDYDSLHHDLKHNEVTKVAVLLK